MRRVVTEMSTLGCVSGRARVTEAGFSFVRTILTVSHAITNQSNVNTLSALTLELM